MLIFFFKQKTAYEMRISDWSSDVFSSDLTWQGASHPVQKTTDSGTEVTVTQTESRAILSWETFNIGRETTLVFDQKRDGTAQTDWVALNRVVGQLDPATGRRDASKDRKSVG